MASQLQMNTTGSPLQVSAVLLSAVQLKIEVSSFRLTIAGRDGTY